MIACNGDISDGSFFVAGQAVLMTVASGVQTDRRQFYLSFRYPAFTPDSPIVVTLLSKNDVAVTKVSAARPQ
jgi:hypothetical protein